MGPWAKSDSSDIDDCELEEENVHVPDIPAVERNTTEAYLDNYMEKLTNTWSGPFKIPSTKVVFHGHTKGINKVRLRGQVVLSCGNDAKIFLWDIATQALLRGYFGHSQAVKDIVFNSNGDRFLSAGLDRKVMVWNTQTGEIIQQVELETVPNAVLFNPNNENEYIVGLDRVITHFDVRQPEPIQTYDHHLGTINSLIAVDSNTKFMSTSDDRTIRLWEWQVNIPVKIIAEPTQHLTPSAAVHPTENFILLQMMDNTVQTIQGSGKFRYNRNKTFSGHRVAGYGVQIALSPDGQVIVSGDVSGFVYFWSWKTGRVLRKMKVSDQVISSVDVGQGVVCAGNSGDIYYLH